MTRISATPITLVASIGNPERRYSQTRHNAGHWLAMMLAERYELDWQDAKVAPGWLAKGEVDRHSIRLYRCGLSMNVCGSAIVRIARFYRVPMEQMLILHDDLDFPPGVMRMKFAGGAGGHNGLKSILSDSNQAQFWRCRIGIDRPPHPSQARNYVLNKPSPAERERILQVLHRSLEALTQFICGDREKAISDIHSQTID